MFANNCCNFFFYFYSVVFFFFFFFFSSRRRHTRFDCDWSSDVCSSDLGARRILGLRQVDGAPAPRRPRDADLRHDPHRREDRERADASAAERRDRSEEHTSELQSQSNLVCRLLLEKKKRLYTHKKCLLI